MIFWVYNEEKQTWKTYWPLPKLMGREKGDYKDKFMYAMIETRTQTWFETLVIVWGADHDHPCLSTWHTMMIMILNEIQWLHGWLIFWLIWWLDAQGWTEQGLTHFAVEISPSDHSSGKPLHLLSWRMINICDTNAVMWSIYVIQML